MTKNEDFIHNRYGWCYFSIEDGMAYIYNLYIEPEHRRKGHARHLLELVIAEIRRAGYTGEIQIEARPREGSIDTESLIKFYERMGLKVIL